MMLGDKRHFRDILKSEEKISTNILAQRLSFLEQQGVVGKRSDASHKQKVLYHLTQKGIDLLPVIVSIAEWSIKYEPVSSESATQARLFLDGGAPMVKKWMSDLKEKHLD